MNRYSSQNALTWMQNENLFNATLDAQIQDALGTIDINQRAAKYIAIQKYIMSITPSIMLFQQLSWRAYQNYVTPPLVKQGVYQKDGTFGKVYSYPASSGGMDFRLFSVDRLIAYN